MAAWVEHQGIGALPERTKSEPVLWASMFLCSHLEMIDLIA